MSKTLDDAFERVESKDISERVLEILKQPPLREFPALPLLAVFTQSMLRPTLDTFMNRDPALARQMSATRSVE